MPVRFRRILYPTDFSKLSLSALQLASGLTETFGATLHCLHVVDDGCQYFSALGPESIPAGPAPDTLLELARERMEKFRKEHLTGLAAEPIIDVVMGNPFAEIIAYAREHQIDLIAMATHGRGAVAQMLLGSTTEKVVRKSPCAVLTVRSAEHDSSMS